MFTIINTPSFFCGELDKQRLTNQRSLLPMVILMTTLILESKRKKLKTSIWYWRKHNIITPWEADEND